MRLLTWYARCNTTHPLSCKVVTVTVLFTCGDVLSQVLEGKRWESFSVERCLRMGGVGACWTGPVLHLYFKRLTQAPFNTFSPLVLTLFDQTVGAVALTASFFMLMGVLSALMHTEGDVHASLRAGVASVQERLAPTMLANWAVWPVLNFISFSYVPPQYRVLWARCVLFEKLRTTIFF